MRQISTSDHIPVDPQEMQMHQLETRHYVDPGAIPTELMPDIYIYIYMVFILYGAPVAPATVAPQ